MSDQAIVKLARKAGLSPRWTDAYGKKRTVTPETMRAVLVALGFPANSSAEINESLGEIEVAATSHGKQRAGRGYSIAGDRKLWGVGVQIYALRGKTAIDFGDFEALGNFAEDAARNGADAVAISPVHALFGARPSHISPYSPSTRLFLNPLYIAAKRSGRSANRAALIDWPRAHARKMRALNDMYKRFDGSSDFDGFVSDGGDRLLSHARFEVLDARFTVRGITGWRNWPGEWRGARNRAVRSLDATQPDVRFQLFLQWQAARGLATAQVRAKSAGMTIGLIADMAVGVDPDGSLAWSSPREMLEGLSIGAPPDMFNTAGQDWGLTTFSPHALRAAGFEGFIATLRATMRDVGGLRLDHAMGLRRLWVIPRGASPADGVYLDYPMGEMTHLIAREFVRHKRIVIAEDLGTVPAGFREAIARSKFYGMRVLWFERDAGGGFFGPEKWDADAAALSTTHDLPTIAGWWTGREIAWRRKTGASKVEIRSARRDRAADKRKLWHALKKARTADGALPAAPGAVVDASLAFLGKTPCKLVVVPVEDLLGIREQPNLPGTIDEHPNWRRRLSREKVFSNKAARGRAAILNKGCS